MLIHLDSDTNKKYTGTYPVTLTIKPHYQQRNDNDNNFKIKWLIDGLVSAGIIEKHKLDKVIIAPIVDGTLGIDIDIQPAKHSDGILDYVNSLSDEDRRKVEEYLKGWDV